MKDYTRLLLNSALLFVLLLLSVHLCVIEATVAVPKFYYLLCL